jgi:hypothetical protein
MQRHCRPLPGSVKCPQRWKFSHLYEKEEKEGHTFFSLSLHPKRGSQGAPQPPWWQRRPH